MASMTLSKLSDILRDIYLGGEPKPVVKPVQWWSCRKHKSPALDQYEERCIFDAECDDYECPHRESFVTKAGCPECKTSNYIHCLSGDTGELAYEVYFYSGIAWQLNQESVFLRMLDT